MPEQFNNKDYGEYFSALQKSIEKNERAVEKPQISQKPQKLFGGIIKVRPWVYVAAVLVVIVLIIILAIPKKEKTLPQTQNTESVASNIKKEEPKVDLHAKYDENTLEISSDIVAESIVFINCDTNKVVAGRDAARRCYPASTTKVMTILTAVDYISNYNDTFTFSYEITDPLYLQEATLAGFTNDEAVNMTDMLYGAILPSGADATIGLAIKIAGSEDAFVKLMNKKAKELGLKDTNFTNTSGLFDQNHYTTAEDMAVIIREAMKNKLCREILSTYQYTTASTPQHPKGIELTSTLFSHMYGTEPEGADILGGKTGFVNESGYCIASFGKSDTGTEYVCVTFKGAGLWPSINDQINLYTKYTK